MKHEVLVGQTDYSVFVFIPDPASTDGSGKTGLVAANLTVSGSRMETDNDATVIDYTASLNDLAALTTAHTDWGVKEISSTLAPGLYRLDIADAIFASGAWSAVVYVMITTSAAAASPMEFVMVPSAPLTGVLLAPVTHTSAVIPTVTTTGTATAVTTVNGLAAGVITATSIAADAITDAKVASDVTIASVTGAVGSVTGLTAATVHSDLDDIQARLPAALVSGRIDASVGAMAAGVLTATAIAADAITDAKVASDVTIASVTGAVGSVTVVSDKTGYTLSATGSAALTESYAADAAAGTLPQLLYMILAVLTEASVSSTTLTAKKLDGSTTAGTFTLNDATSPTSITRAS